MMHNLIVEGMDDIEELRERCLAADEEIERLRDLLIRTVEAPSFRFQTMKAEIAQALDL